MSGDELDPLHALKSQFLKLYPSHCEGAGCWQPGDPEPPMPEDSGGTVFDQAEQAFMLAEVARATQWRRMVRKATCGKNQGLAFILAAIIGATWSPMGKRSK